MKLSDEFKAHIRKPGLNDKQFNKLVTMIRNETDIVKIYDWLNSKFKDPRTVQKWLDKALLEARKFPIDNGDE